MEDKRPGEAAVHYDDVRGEAAGDISDRLHSLERVAQELGFNRRGTVVGISVYGGDESRRDPGLVTITLQVIHTSGIVGEINRQLAESDGVLEVVEQCKSDVPIVDFMRCFKRLEVSLFQRHINARTIRVVDEIHMEDVED